MDAPGRTVPGRRLQDPCPSLLVDVRIDGRGRAFLESAFGDAGRAVAERLTRPRLSYNVAVYHRTLNEEPA